jgi:hypothetical protein
VDFSILTGTGGVRAATFLATLPESREALDHRLFAPTASGVALSPGCLHVDNRLRELDLVQRSTTWCPVGLSVVGSQLSLPIARSAPITDNR